MDLKIEKLRKLELELWNDSDFIKKLEPTIQEEGLDVLNLHFYGEISFVLRNLKPCMIFSFGEMQIKYPKIYEEVMQIYKEKVLDKCELALGLPQESIVFKFQKLPKQIFTPYFDSSNCYFLLNAQNPICISFLQQLSQCNKDRVMISEEYMASLLDYPVALPEKNTEGIAKLEVSYIDEANGRILTTYGCIQSDYYWNKVKQHFTLYKETCSTAIRLKLEIADLSSQ